MVLGFLFWFLLLGLILASLQDLKRREVDNWLNILMIVSCLSFALFSAIFNSDLKMLVYAGFSLAVCYGLAHLFYYGRIFGGGDAKLLIALFLVFISGSFLGVLENLGIFLLILVIIGGFWGLCYSLILFFVYFNKTKKDFLKIGWLVFLLVPVLFYFMKAVEKNILIHLASSNGLKEGDLLLHDINVHGKTIKKNWEGLSLKQIDFLKKHNAKVWIKDGIPFVPAFLVAFLVFVLFKDALLGILATLL